MAVKTESFPVSEPAALAQQPPMVGPAAGSGSERVPHRAMVTAALMLVMVLASMEATVTSTAMPTIIGDLHGLEHYAWVASIYLLASTVTMPLYGRLADAVGRKKIMIVAITLFAVGSICAAFSHSMLQLILFRSVQGLGAGGIMPVVLTIIGDIFTVQERAKMQGFFSVIWGSASLAGPWLGATLVKTTKYANHFPDWVRPWLGWPMIFWVNLPAGFLGLAVLAAYYKDRERPHKTDLDLPGLALLAIGTTLLLAGVSLAAGTTVPVWVAVGLIVIGIAALGVFYRVERGAANPIISPRLLVNRHTGPAIVASLLLGCGVFALDTYVPLYVQGGRGGSATDASHMVTPVMLAWATSSFFAAPLVLRWGFRKCAIIGSCFVVAGYTGVLIAATLGAPFYVLTLLLFLTGCGFGPASMSYLIGAQNAVSWQERGGVTSLISFGRTIGGALGVGILGTLFNVLTVKKLGAVSGISPADLLDPHKLEAIPAATLVPAQTLIAHGLIWVFGAMLFAAVAQVVVSTQMAKVKPMGLKSGEGAVGGH